MPIINNGNTLLLLVAASATLARWREKNACFVIHLAVCVSCAEECFMKAKRKLIECQFNAVIGVLFLHFLRSGVQSNRNVIDRNMDTKNIYQHLRSIRSKLLPASLSVTNALHFLAESIK